jgi:hypothetical protein
MTTAMNVSAQIANHFKQVHFGGNWTDVNLKQTLSGVNWQQATTKVYSLNTIAALTYHINYFVVAVLNVLQGTPLTAHDKYSFDLPPINSEEDWKKLLDKIWSDAEKFVTLVEQLPESKLDEIFVLEKYGTYHRNLLGVIEHTHYHLGQIVVIKKILQQQSAA